MLLFYTYVYAFICLQSTLIILFYKKSYLRISQIYFPVNSEPKSCAILLYDCPHGCWRTCVLVSVLCVCVCYSLDLHVFITPLTHISPIQMHPTTATLTVCTCVYARAYIKVSVWRWLYRIHSVNQSPKMCSISNGFSSCRCSCRCWLAQHCFPVIRRHTDLVAVLSLFCLVWFEWCC